VCRYSCAILRAALLLDNRLLCRLLYNVHRKARKPAWTVNIFKMFPLKPIRWFTVVIDHRQLMMTSLSASMTSWGARDLDQHTAVSTHLHRSDVPPRLTRGGRRNASHVYRQKYVCPRYRCIFHVWRNLPTGGCVNCLTRSSRRVVYGGNANLSSWVVAMYAEGRDRTTHVAVTIATLLRCEVAERLLVSVVEVA